MATSSSGRKYTIKEPGKLSKRIEKLRDFYFQGTERKWNNAYTAWTTGMDWDVLYNELSYHIVPETYMLLQTLRSSYKQAAKKIKLNNDFWSWPLPERRAWFVREVMTKYLPAEILPGNLIAGGRFNIQSSLCLNKKEAKKYDNLVIGKHGVRAGVKCFHEHGYGNCGATSGHLIPDYKSVLTKGWRGIKKDLEEKYNKLSRDMKKGRKGSQLRAMIISAGMPQELAARYGKVCINLAETEENPVRREELLSMSKNLSIVPWEPAETFWEAVQSLWISHMLVMSDENYPGPGVSFGRIDQYLFPYWEKSVKEGMSRDFGKEILKCFWIHANTAYDALIQNGNQGITAGFGQLITLSGMGKDRKDMTNDLTYVILEVIDEMSPILEPKTNVRLHRNSPEKLLDTVVNSISKNQGAPFLLNFDERSMAGMMREAESAGLKELINKNNVFEYAPVGCLENTMTGNDRSGTVDNNLNLLKAVELVFGNGRDMFPCKDLISGKTEKIWQDGPVTGDPRKFTTFEQFWNAYEFQTKNIIKKCVSLYERSESIRARYYPTPYLSCMVRGCAEKGIDITQGGAEINLTTLEAVTYATTVDSLLAVKYLIYDNNKCTMDQLIRALKNNWKGHEKLQAHAMFKAPKYGRDNSDADAMGKKVMNLWAEECWKYRTVSTNRQFRPGMLSWNYWAGDGFILAASPDGRPKGQFLSNAICPSNGADINGPTSNTNSVGKVLGGRNADGTGDWENYYNVLPNGASHTISFNPSIVRDSEHKDKFKAYLKGYMENGGTALQINMVSPEMLKDAQKHPQDYRSLLVRVTGYNAYFTSIGKELQDELIHRTSHNKF